MRYRPKYLLLLATWLALMVLAAGCPQRNYKLDADERVYNIIDAQWDPSFGSKANYRVGDAGLSPDNVQIDRYTPIPGVLTLPRAVAVATANNREYQRQKELLYTTALDQRLVRHGYETQLFGGAGALYLRDRDSDAVQFEANVGFNRLLTTGALISTRVGIRWIDMLMGQGDSGFASIFGATVAQPLLRGSDPMIVLEPLTQAERNTLYQIRTFNRFRKTFVVAVISQYYQILELHEVAKNAEDYYNALVTLRDRVEKLVNVARLPSEELDRVRQEVLLARDAQIVAQTRYERALDAYKITLGVPPTTEFGLDVDVFDTLQARGIPFPDFAVSEAVDTALVRRLDLINTADMVLDAQRAVYVAADALRPGLTATGSIDINSRGDRTIAAGPVLDLALDRVPEQVAYRNALLTLEQRRRDYDETADTIRLEIREAHRRLLEAARRYEVLVEGVQTAQDRIQKNYVLMDYGRTSSRRVLNALENLYSARNEMANALVDYVIATLNFYRDTDVLQVRPDGMWELGAGAVPLARTSAPMGMTAPAHP